jgi:ferric-dicitrate binding protein FerR (iron transport regulator)
MKDYRSYTLLDLVSDDDFIRWVQEGDAADRIFWEEWLRRNPDKAALVEEAKQVLTALRIESPSIGNKEVNQEIERLMRTLQEPHAGKPLRPIRHLPRRRTLGWAAALLAFTVGIFLFYRTAPGGKGNPFTGNFGYTAMTASRHFIERVNGSGKPDTLLLPDSSVVVLAADSRISYSPIPPDSSATRDLYLSGEALFKVVRHPHHPLRVFAGDVVTRVLGTSFLVRSFEKDSIIQVTVLTGKVSVSVQPHSDRPAGARSGGPSGGIVPGPHGIIVTCNQRLVYEKAGQIFEKDLLENPLPLSPDLAGRRMVFEDTPLVDVFNQLRKDYGINIIFDSELLRKCTVTADLTGETFYRKLDLICSAVGAHYEMIDGQVLIQSAGCR